MSTKRIASRDTTDMYTAGCQEFERFNIFASNVPLLALIAPPDQETKRRELKYSDWDFSISDL